VVLSSKEIAYIKTRKLDALVVMSQPAMDQYRPKPWRQIVKRCSADTKLSKPMREN